MQFISQKAFANDFFQIIITKLERFANIFHYCIFKTEKKTQKTGKIISQVITEPLGWKRYFNAFSFGRVGIN